jgi:hypothetical protein
MSISRPISSHVPMLSPLILLLLPLLYPLYTLKYHCLQLPHWIHFSYLGSCNMNSTLIILGVFISFFFYFLALFHTFLSMQFPHLFFATYLLPDWTLAFNEASLAGSFFGREARPNRIVMGWTWSHSGTGASVEFSCVAHVFSLEASHCPLGLSKALHSSSIYIFQQN